MITRAAVQKAAAAFEPGDFYRRSHGQDIRGRPRPPRPRRARRRAHAPERARGARDARGGRREGTPVHDREPRPRQLERSALREHRPRKSPPARPDPRRPGNRPLRHRADHNRRASPRRRGSRARSLRARQEAKEDRRAIGGATWLEQATPGVPAVWGAGDVVLWAEGEPFMLYGPDGVGKTSICQQLVLHMCGVRLEPLLGLPVRRAERPILYVSADRPKQARRSLARMVDAGDYASPRRAPPRLGRTPAVRDHRPAASATRLRPTPRRRHPHPRQPERRHRRPLQRRERRTSSARVPMADGRRNRPVRPPPSRAKPPPANPPNPRRSRTSTATGSSTARSAPAS
jgi:hypothetical protein